MKNEIYEKKNLIRKNVIKMKSSIESKKVCPGEILTCDL